MMNFPSVILACPEKSTTVYEQGVYLAVLRLGLAKKMYIKTVSDEYVIVEYLNDYTYFSILSTPRMFIGIAIFSCRVTSVTILLGSWKWNLVLISWLVI